MLLCDALKRLAFIDGVVGVAVYGFLFLLHPFSFVLLRMVVSPLGESLKHLCSLLGNVLCGLTMNRCLSLLVSALLSALSPGLLVTSAAL